MKLSAIVRLGNPAQLARFGATPPADDSEVVRLEDYRKDYAENYKKGTINLLTHPIMRRFDDSRCHSNIFHEMAHITSVSCLHQCIRESCGGDPLSGDGCRFETTETYCCSSDAGERQSDGGTHSSSQNM